jgi:hypothetical protein
MKKLLFVFVLALLGISFQANAQKWSELSDEQKWSKAQDFRDDNQNYLKNTLKMSDDQLSDIDNVNICYLSTLDRIDRYGKTDADKEKYAKSVTAARSAQLDAIMGVDNRKKFQAYVQEKLKKAGVKM